MGSNCNGWPNFDAWLQNFWGAGQEFWSSGPGAAFQGATNLVYGQNPPYALDDFWQVYPQFFGLATAVSGCGTTSGSAVITVPTVNGLMPGQFLMCQGVPTGAVITSLGNNSVTVNNKATVTASGITMQVFEAMPVPAAVIKMYLNLAYASLQWLRWREQWYIAMSLFIAHYCTLWAQTSATELVLQLVNTIHGETPGGAIPGSVFTLSAVPPGGALESLTLQGLFQTPGIDYTLDGLTITMTVPIARGSLWATWPVQIQQFTAVAQTPASIAAQGLAGGIQTSKSVGDVSVSYQVLESLKDWGAWNLTKFGQLLATMAKVIGSGPMVIW